MYLIGRGRYARETYPEPNQALAAFQDRLITAPAALPGFAPATAPATSLVGAALVTPKASGVFLLMVQLLVDAPVADDTFTLVAFPGTGPNLTLSGGDVTSNGWVFGTTTPPIIGGGPVVLNNEVAQTSQSIPAGKASTLVLVGANDTPLPSGVKSVFQLELTEGGSGNAIGVLVASAVLIELP